MQNWRNFNDEWTGHVSDMKILQPYIDGAVARLHWSDVEKKQMEHLISKVFNPFKASNSGSCKLVAFILQHPTLSSENIRNAIKKLSSIQQWGDRLDHDEVNSKIWIFWKETCDFDIQQFLLLDP